MGVGISCSQNVTQVTVASPSEQDAGPFNLPDGAPAAKASRLYLPPTNSTVNDGGSIPGVVMVHGFCAESWLAGVATSAHLVGSFDALDWTCMGPLAEAVAAQGVAVLMVGLHDGDEQLYPELEGMQASLINTWSQADYAKFLRVGIDHFLKVCPQLDKKRIGLVGHSLGGGGVLRAAATSCREHVAAVVALNPSHMSVETPGDMFEHGVKYRSGAEHSGEFGEGNIAHLASVTAPTLVYGSQAEYNTPLKKLDDSVAPMWPAYPSVFAQLGASTKELYVDNLVAHTCTQAHCWLLGRDNLRAFGDGIPLQVVCSFLRRMLLGAAEVPMKRPSNAKEWESHGDVPGVERKK